MKKLLVLALVLGMAGMVNATVLELSIGGVVDGPENVTEIALNPSDTIMIDVHCTADPDFVDFWITVDGPGSLAGVGTIVSPPAPAAAMDTQYAGWLWFSTSGSPTPAPTLGEWWYEEFHCDGDGDVTINLYDPTGATVIDTILIHQPIPEPMTIALLGLGGLLLRRRKA